MVDNLSVPPALRDECEKIVKSLIEQRKEIVKQMRPLQNKSRELAVTIGALKNTFGITVEDESEKDEE
jgi:hypothetical protein